MNNEIPPDATHTRDGDIYRVTSKVEYYCRIESLWFNCKDRYDLTGWLAELTPLKSKAP